jgi:alpha-galactosidase
MTTASPRRARVSVTACQRILMLLLSSSACFAARLPAETHLNREWAEKAFSESKAAPLPFSFIYGGKPSREIVGRWKRSVDEIDVSDTSRRRTLTLTDPATGMEVRAVATIYIDTPGVDWTVYFTNKGTSDSPVLEQVKAVDTSLALGAGDAILHRLKGSTCSPDDWMPIDEPLSVGKRVEFGAQNGRSSAESPFFNIQWNGGGCVTGIGWSGQWRASVERRGDGQIALQAGMEFLHISLRPNETIRSPRVLQVYWTGDDQFDGCNQFRRTMFAHILPRIDGRLVTPVVTNCAAGIPTAAPGLFWQYMAAWTESQASEEFRVIQGLGYEFFWLDAYFTRGNFPNGIGNYGFPINEILTDPVRFPHGPKPLSQRAHQQGLKFLLWFEPERAAKETYLAKKHPEWILFDPTGKDGGVNNLFNLAIPEAREYMTKYLIAAIREYGMDCLRIDFNLDPLPLWQIENAKNPNRVGISEIRYVEGLYRMWDDILAAYPKLFIDNCASGGRRIDLETCSRSIPLWRTDAQSPPSIALDYNQSSIQNQAMSAGLNRYVPFSTGGQIVGRPYDFRSGFNGGIVIWSIPTKEQRDILRQGIVEGKQIRKYWLGDFYPLSNVSPNPKDWCVTQYHLPRAGEGIVIAFRRHKAEGRTYECKLREIDPKGTYDVCRSCEFERSPQQALTGEQLANFLIEIPDRPGSMIVEYKLR